MFDFREIICNDKESLIIVQNPAGVIFEIRDFRHEYNICVSHSFFLDSLWYYTQSGEINPNYLFSNYLEKVQEEIRFRGYNMKI